MKLLSHPSSISLRRGQGAIRFLSRRSSGPWWVRGVLVRKGDRWTCTRACDEVNIPPTLHGLLLSRVDRLPAEARRMLQEAAVLGMTFDRALLEAIAT